MPGSIYAASQSGGGGSPAHARGYHRDLFLVSVGLLDRAPGTLVPSQASVFPL